MKRITKDGKEIDLSFAQRDEMFALGMRAAKEGWGHEGSAIRRNGPRFMLGWSAYLVPGAKSYPLPFTYAEILGFFEENK